MLLNDEQHLRHAIELARQAVERGNHPFGATLVAADGTLLAQAENTVSSAGDITAHAELNLVRDISGQFDAERLHDCTLYASTEPCAMCAGAIYWSGIGRVVYGCPAARLNAIVADLPDHDALDLPCREVLRRGDHPVEVVGPVLADEAAAIHVMYWTRAKG